MIKVLHLYTTLDGGGVESFLYNYYSHMNLNDIKFDLIVPGDRIGYLEPIFLDMGSDVFHICRMKENPVKHIWSLWKIIRNGQYNIIHCHGYKSALGVLLATVTGCNCRIIHSHMAYVDEGFVGKIARKMLTIIAKKCATAKFACGKDAARWLFGEKELERGEVRIIHNAIDIHKYAYSDKKRDKSREKLNLSNEFVIGNVARLTRQKNQEFLISVFEKILTLNHSAVLVMIGDGEDREKLENRCVELGIEQHVKFLGTRTDIPELLSAMDVFALPSLYEGLPVVLAEVQAAGLYCVVSDSVTTEVDVTGGLHYMSLKESCEKWAECIIKLAEDNHPEKRYKTIKEMQYGNYDIIQQANNLYKIYSELVNE